MIFLCRNFNNLGIFIWFVKIFDTNDLRDFAFGNNRVTNRLKALQLNFQQTFDDIILFERGDLNCNLDLSLLSFSNLESNFFKVLKSLITSNREHILI